MPPVPTATPLGDPPQQGLSNESADMRRYRRRREPQWLHFAWPNAPRRSSCTRPPDDIVPADAQNQSIAPSHCQELAASSIRFRYTVPAVGVPPRGPASGKPEGHPVARWRGAAGLPDSQGIAATARSADGETAVRLRLGLGRQDTNQTNQSPGLSTGLKRSTPPSSLNRRRLRSSSTPNVKAPQRYTASQSRLATARPRLAGRDRYFNRTLRKTTSIFRPLNPISLSTQST